jgi:anti-anti-sigma factor
MTINTREKDGVVIFDIQGEIRRSETGTPTLHQVVKSHLDSDRSRILLNLSGVEFIDSFGVGEILASFISAQNLGGKLKLMNISPKLYVVFKVTMLTKVLEIFENEDKALTSFN